MTKLWTLFLAPALLFSLSAVLAQDVAPPAEKAPETQAPAAQQAQANNNDQQAQTSAHWDDLLHYAMIGQWEMARAHGQALIDMKPDPVALLNLAESQRYSDSYKNLMALRTDSPIKDIADAVLKIVEEGRYSERTDPQRIAAEIARLSTTTRGRMLAIERLKDSGEWAVPVIINTLRDPQRVTELANIRWALPQLGRDAVNPLVVTLQGCPELNIRLIVLDALAQIGYETALPYVKQIIDTESANSKLQEAAVNTFRAIDRHQQYATLSAADLFLKLADDYYNHLPSLEVPANVDQANIWFWDQPKGLAYERVSRHAFNELMAMRSCELAMKINPNLSQSVSLWLSAFFRLEADGQSQPAYFGQNHPDAQTYALTCGPEYLHQVLARAIKDQNRPVALAAVKTLQRNSGQQSLLYALGSNQPLIDAMSFPDRQVRYCAALAIGQILPQKSFEHNDMVVPILAEALRQHGEKYAVIVDDDQQRRNQLSGELVESKQYTEVLSNTHFTSVLEKARRWGNIDMVIIADNIQQPDVRNTLQLIKDNYRVAFCPVILISDNKNLSDNKKLMEKFPFLEVVLDRVSAADVEQLRQTILTRTHSSEFDAKLADSYALAAVNVLRRLAVNRNTILDVKAAETELTQAIRDARPEIQQAAIETLAQVDSLDAQRNLAVMALDEKTPTPIRLLTLSQLSLSAKSYGNLLLSEHIDGLYQIIQSGQLDSQLRSQAAEAFGALNLPSARTSQLILSQMRN